MRSGLLNCILFIVAFCTVTLVVKVSYDSNALDYLRGFPLLQVSSMQDNMSVSSSSYTLISGSSSSVLRPDPIVCSDAYCSLCDIVIKGGSDNINKNATFDGVVICLKTDYLHKMLSFAKENTKKYALITLYSDYYVPKSRERWPGDFTSLLQDPNLMVWYGLNVVERHCKLKTIPIGIPNGLEAAVRQGVAKFRKNFDERRINVYINFSVRREALRMNVYKKFCGMNSSFPGVVCRQPNASFEEYARDLGDTKFIISPIGNGIDCYRHYESMLFGAIPIVLRQKLPGLFHELPLLAVDSYDEVTPEFLLNATANAEKLSSASSLDKLYLPYWKREIENVLAYYGFERHL